jgi:hypothetical protein
VLERATVTSSFERAFRTGFETGRFAGIAEWYADDAVFENWVAGSCEQVRGGPAIARHLELPWHGPAPLSHWRATGSSGGYEVQVQRAVAAGERPEIAQLHLIHLDGAGRIGLHLVYPAGPRDAAALDAELLADLVPGVDDVQVIHSGTSGATLYRAQLRDGSTVVIKHASPATDWLMRATRDHGREVLLWQAGVFEALRPALDCPIIGAKRLGDGWLVVMRDVAHALAALDRDPSADVPRIFEAAAALHATPLPDDVSMLCTSAARLRLFAPVRPFVEWRGAETIPKTLTRMWEVFAERPETDVVDAVFACIEDPGELLARLARLPQTLLHGDLRLPNIGRNRDSTVLIDWALACLGPAELDIVWFVSDATFWSATEPHELVETWSRSSGVAPDSEAVDLAFVFHAVMGEVAYLAHELVQRPAGSTRPSPARVAWWLERVRTAFERSGLT